MTHYNVQVHIQEVHEPEPIREGSGYSVKLSGGPVGGQKVAMTEKRVIPLLEMKITAPTEVEAYDRAQRLLETNRPVRPVAVDDDLPPIINPRV